MCYVIVSLAKPSLAGILFPPPYLSQSLRCGRPILQQLRGKAFIPYTIRTV